MSEEDESEGYEDELECDECGEFESECVCGDDEAEYEDECGNCGNLIEHCTCDDSDDIGDDLD